jgi:hypothetical protein
VAAPCAGLDQTPVERRGPDRSLPLITGAYGGHTIDFREFAAQGITGERISPASSEHYDQALGACD